MRALLVGIGGGSGSGKSTLARAIADRREASRVVELDWYYRDLSGLETSERSRWNFDHPDALDWELMLEQLRRLTLGEEIQPPVYDFATHTRGGALQVVEPGSLILLEGILVLHSAEVRRALDLGIYVAASEPVRLARRLERDVRERGRTPDSVHEQFARTVRPMHERFVEPTRAHADLVADGEGDFGPAVERAFALLEGRARSRSA